MKNKNTSSGKQKTKTNTEAKGKTGSKGNAKAASQDSKEKKNPITVTFKEDGTAEFHGRAFNITACKNAALEEYGKILFQYGQQLMLLPTEEQAEQIRRTNGCARVVSNDYYDARQSAYDKDKSVLSVSQYKASRFKELKEEKPFLCDVDKFALEAAIEHVDDAYSRFLKKKSGFPKKRSKYKPSGNRYTTKQTNNNIGLVRINGVPYIKLPKLGNVRFIIPSGKLFSELVPANGRITKATVIKDGRNYLVSLQIETVIEKGEPLTTYTEKDIVAMDMGLKEFCIYGSMEGERTHIENPKWIKKHERRLRRLQKALSRKKYDQKTHTGSKNYYKAKERVAKEQRKIANQRKDFHHKLSRTIADHCKVFICEDLNIQGMMKNRHLAKAIQSVGWGQFLAMLKYKIERKGGIFRKVSRWYPSSKTCTHCGYKKKDLTLNDRYWVCPNCHTLINRDENAVDNLLKEGVRLLGLESILLVAS